MKKNVIPELFFPKLFHRRQTKSVLTDKPNGIFDLSDKKSCSKSKKLKKKLRKTLKKWNYFYLKFFLRIGRKHSRQIDAFVWLKRFLLKIWIFSYEENHFTNFFPQIFLPETKNQSWQTNLTEFLKKILKFYRSISHHN